ncbi:hypothetical protein [Moorena producens]|uniref:hypothetical protein n=1 Tax=Moorena producens TaxID=1155739 RepID=UPI0011EA683F|nr:hypothetical protein [Moorena producens]
MHSKRVDWLDREIGRWGDGEMGRWGDLTGVGFLHLGKTWDDSEEEEKKNNEQMMILTTN